MYFSFLFSFSSYYFFSLLSFRINIIYTRAFFLLSFNPFFLSMLFTRCKRFALIATYGMRASSYPVSRILFALPSLTKIISEFVTFEILQNYINWNTRYYIPLNIFLKIRIKYVHFSSNVFRLSITPIIYIRLKTKIFWNGRAKEEVFHRKNL